MKKLKILISAFAFDPREPMFIEYSAGYVAWKMVEQITNFCDVCVVTTQEYRDIILEALSDGHLPGVSIHFVNVPSSYSRLKKTLYGKYRRSVVWHRQAMEYSKHLHAESAFDAAHHLFLGPDRLPVHSGASPALPFVWGPLPGDVKKSSALRRIDSKMSSLRNGWEHAMHWLTGHHCMYKKSAQSARAILVSDPEAVLQFPKIDKRKIHIFPYYGLDSYSAIFEKKTRKRRNLFTVISAGSFQRESGFDLLIKAFHLFERICPKSVLLLFGDGPEKIQCERIIQKRKLQDKIHIHPSQEKSSMREKMHEGDVFVNLSQREDGSAWIIESMAAGLPVVSLHVGGAGYLNQGDWIIKVKAGSREHLTRGIAQALEKLFSEGRLRKKMARAAARNAANCTWDRLGKKLQRVYGEAFLQEEDVLFSRKGKDRFSY